MHSDLKEFFWSTLSDQLPHLTENEAVDMIVHRCAGRCKACDSGRLLRRGDVPLPPRDKPCRRCGYPYSILEIAWAARGVEE